MNITGALDYFKDSVKALEARFDFLGEDFNIGFELRYALRENYTLIQLWLVNVPSNHATEVMWESVSIQYKSKDEVHALLNELVGMGFILSSAPMGKVQETCTSIPMYEFHPQRFRAVLPFVKQIGQKAQNGEPMFTMEAFQFGTGQLIHDFNFKNDKTPLRYRNTDHRAVQKLVEASMFYGDFVTYGRQIFDFPQSLVESFRKSDVEDIPLDAIALPYESFYLHFGAQEDLETAPGWHPDGAYVARIGDVKGDHLIQFCLTSINKDQMKYEDWAANPEPLYIQGVSSELMGTGIGEAVDHVISAKIAELQKQINSSMQNNIDEALKNGELSELSYKEVVDVSGKNAQKELEKLPKLHTVWREMLNLVINSIAYLTSYREDVRTEWPKKTPKDLLGHSTDGTPKQKQRAKSKLAALGYTSIHFCGTKFVEMITDDIPSGGNGKRKPTWVRGSWVWQPHGTKHSLRRLQWRMPHVRNKENDIDEDSMGHLYLVS